MSWTVLPDRSPAPPASPPDGLDLPQAAGVSSSAVAATVTTVVLLLPNCSLLIFDTPHFGSATRDRGSGGGAGRHRRRPPGPRRRRRSASRSVRRGSPVRCSARPG